MTREDLFGLLLPNALESDYRDLLYSTLESQSFKEQHLLIAVYFTAGPQSYTWKKVQKNTSWLVGLGTGYFKESTGYKVVPLDMVLPWAINFIEQHKPIPDVLYEQTGLSLPPPIPMAPNKGAEWCFRVLKGLAGLNRSMIANEEFLKALHDRTKLFGKLLELAWVLCREGNMDMVSGHIMNDKLLKTTDIAALMALWEHWIMVQDAWNETVNDRVNKLLAKRVMRADPGQFLERFTKEMQES